MHTLLYSEINIFSIIVLFTVMFNSSVFGVDTKNKNRLFSCSACFAAMSCICDFLWEMSAGGYLLLSRSAAVLVNTMYFICYALSFCCWFLYVESIAESKIFKRKKRAYIAILPLAALVILLAASVFTGCVFSIDESLNYTRGPLFFMQVVLSYGYIAAAVIRILYDSIGSKNKFVWDNIIFAAVFACPIIAASTLQAFFPELPIACLGIVLAFMNVYVYSLKVHVSVDMLTGIANRHKLMNELEDRISSLKKDEKLYFLFLDIDSFKQINDTFGHHEGDNALKSVAAVLKTLCKTTGGFCARYGGDEFAVIQVLKKSGDIKRIKKNIYDSVEKITDKNSAYSLSVSIGCAQHTSETESVQELISCADSNMYSKKMQRKEKIKR